MFELNEDGYRRLDSLRKELDPRGVVKKAQLYLSKEEIELIQYGLCLLMDEDYTASTTTFKKAQLLGYEFTDVKNRIK